MISVQLAKNKQLGVGLIEVMISILVLAVGVLGYLALQTQSLRQQQESYYFARTNLFANDLFEMMRLNPAEASKVSSAYKKDINEIIAMDKDCAAVICDAAQLAGYHVHLWSTRVLKELPTAEANISTNASGVASVQITFPEILVMRELMKGEVGYEEGKKKMALKPAVFKFETRL